MPLPVKVIQMLLGAALLIAGLYIMRYGLKQTLWQKLRYLLARVTHTPGRGLVVGTVAAALLQSSTAVSLITIGLVSAQYLSFFQGLGIILGANIGTCSTVQIIAASPPPRLLLPALLGLAMAAASRRLRYPALAGIGLCTMFLGLSLLSDALSHLTDNSATTRCLALAVAHPWYGLAAGIGITFLFQSSSAATGLVMLLAGEGLIDLTAATYLVYGNNIGSCLSSLIAGAAAPVAARQVAVSHILLNVLGVLFFWPFTGVLAQTAAWLTDDFAQQVAMVHTIFNILSSLLVLPFSNGFARLVTWLVPSGSGES